jgi:hypothetical protein
VGPSSGQVDGPQDAGGALGDRTPGGTALQAPPAVIEKVGDLPPTLDLGTQRTVVRDPAP